MNEMQVFENIEFGKLEIITIGGKEYFPAIACANILGYSNPRDSVSRHCPHVVKRDVGVKTGIKADGTAATQVVEKTFIPEGDLYRLIIRSKLPAAEKFERWVFDEVLPTLRKTGRYDVAAPSQYMALPKDYVSALRALADSEEQKQLLIAENKVLAKEAMMWDINSFINSVVKAYSAAVVGKGPRYAVAWNEFKSALNNKCKININQRVTWYHKKTGKKTPPKRLDLLDENEKLQAAALIVAMCRDKGVDISDHMRHVPVTLPAVVQ